SLDRLARRAIGGHVATRLLQSNAVLSGQGEQSARTRRPVATAAANSGTWAVEAWSVQTAPLYPYGILWGGLLLAALLGAVARGAERTRHDELHAAVARVDELSVVARLGPLLQQSLDMSELLPLFVVEIADRLHLEHASISLNPSSGKLVRAFSLGNGAPPSGIDLASLATVPAWVAAGDHI